MSQCFGPVYESTSWQGARCKCKTGRYNQDRSRRSTNHRRNILTRPVLIVSTGLWFATRPRCWAVLAPWHCHNWHRLLASVSEYLYCRLSSLVIAIATFSAQHRVALYLRNMTHGCKQCDFKCAWKLKTQCLDERVWSGHLKFKMHNLKLSSILQSVDHLWMQLLQLHEGLKMMFRSPPSLMTPSWS